MKVLLIAILFASCARQELRKSKVEVLYINGMRDTLEIISYGNPELHKGTLYVLQPCGRGVLMYVGLNEVASYVARYKILK